MANDVSSYQGQQEIAAAIKKYINPNLPDSAIWFNSRAQLKAADLPAGRTVAIRGILEPNDGRASFYYIREKTPEDVESLDLIFLDNENVAEYIQFRETVLPIGHEYFTTNPNIPDGSLPLLGGEYSRETYSDLWAWVQTQTGYLITDSAWVTLSNTQNGNVPFYSSGDGSTTFRVPSLKCWIKGKNGTETVGTYLQAGLPNITGSLYAYSWDDGGSYGAFGNAPEIINMQMESGNIIGHIQYNLDASRSSSIYGNSSTVQPESIIGMWLVKAYGVVVDSGSIEVKDYIDEQINRKAGDLLVGSVQAFAGNTLPTGWLLCDGSAISRTDYADLYAVIGTSYGAGDGTSTFNLPNLTDKFIQGNATSGTEHGAGLPNITGGVNYFLPVSESSTATGAFGWGSTTSSRSVSDVGNNIPDYFTIDASRSSSIYGNSTTVQPPSVTMRYIIKY